MKVLVIGASTNPARYAHRATLMLKEYGHYVCLYGLKSGEVAGSIIETDKALLLPVDTITLYVGPTNQGEVAEIVERVRAKMVIFNPGTENYTLQNELTSRGVEVVEGCTLVMLRTNSF